MDTGELYVLPPERFTAARDAAVKQAKADGDKDAAATLKALRRPSVSAWLVNRLSSEQAELLEQLLSLGPALAQAQAGGFADDLRALGQQRRQLVEAVADGAVASAGRQVGGPVRDEVVSTLEAALADPASADAVRSGRLVRALSYAGFGEVDLSGAVAAPAPPAPAGTGRPGRALGGSEPTAADRATADEQAAAQRREQVADAERRALATAGSLDDAVRAAERADRQAAAAANALEQADTELQRAAEALDRATRAREAAATASRRAAELAERARGAVGPAQDAAERARLHLDELRRHASS